MKVGDLVKYLVKFKSGRSRSIGLVIETGVYVGNTDVKVAWLDGDTTLASVRYLEVINETR